MKRKSFIRRLSEIFGNTKLTGLSGYYVKKPKIKRERNNLNENIKKEVK